MAWSTPGFLTNGVSTLSAAQCDTQIIGNLDWIARGSSVKVQAEPLDISNSTETNLDIGGGDQTGDNTWDTDNLLNVASDKLDFGTRRTGIWFGGARSEWEGNATGKRILNVEQIDDTIVLNYTAADGVNVRKHRQNVGTIYGFDSAKDFAARVTQTSGGLLEVEGAVWGQWLGFEEYTVDAIVDVELNDDDGITTWWNNWRQNIRRLYRRPFGRVDTVSQSVSASTWTVVDFTAQDADTANMVVTSSEEKIYARHNGWYLVTGWVQVNAFNGAQERVILSSAVNGARYGFPSGGYTVGAGALAVNHQQIIRLEDGDYVELQIFQDGGTETVSAGAMSAVLLSSDEYPAPDNPRQFFPDGAPTKNSSWTTDFAFTAPDSGELPRGLANLMSRDVFLHMWNPQVLGLDRQGEPYTSIGAKSWERVGFDRVRFDGWATSRGEASLTHADRITIPYDGIWLAVASAYFDSTLNQGNDFDFGARIQQNGATRGAVREPVGMNVDTVGPTLQISNPWPTTFSVPLDCEAGDEIALDVFQSSDDDVDLVNASLTLVWMRERP